MDIGHRTSSSFAASNYFPQRRRVIQACLNCRNRKTRCDGSKPKCGWCTSQNAECVYSEAQEPRIEPNTRILLERIQLLEDRLLSAHAQQGYAATSSLQTGSQVASLLAPSDQTQSTSAHTDAEGPQSGHDLDIPITLLHNANANHVYKWPTVTDLLAESPIAPLPAPYGDGEVEATDAFLHPKLSSYPRASSPVSWMLFAGEASLLSPQQCERLIRLYFETANVFFPLFSRREIYGLLEDVVSSEVHAVGTRDSLPPARYALLLLVLCLASFISTGRSSIHLGPRQDVMEEDDAADDEVVDSRLWTKSCLLQGFITSELTMESAQCAMLAALYTGAKGKVADSFQWIRAAAVKCEALARRPKESLSDSFCRLYWIAYIYEADLTSEISVTLPSGIGRYEDHVPYPAFDAVATGAADSSPASVASAPNRDPIDELIAFQVSTNVAIRRSLNRVNSMVYDRRDQFRMTRASYASWLLRTTEDLWAHHAAIFRSLPDFLLYTDNGYQIGLSQDKEATDRYHESQREIRGNDPWNVVRLRGRYYAGQYIVHRPFIEYVLLNSAHFNSHPCKAAVLERCGICFEGCRGFIKVFDVDPANSLTGLFAVGMATFTMVIMLRVATICTVFHDTIPGDIEDIISIGKRNMQRFSLSVREFGWHLRELDRLDAACNERRRRSMETQN